MQDNFKDKASTWDKGSPMLDGAKTIADAIESRIQLDASMSIMDFGTGTGLLGFLILKKVKSVLGVDTSASMLKKLQEKNTSDFTIDTLNVDITKTPISTTFDGIISSMTLHHIEDLKHFFKSIYENLNEGGFIAIADLEKEDGTFHKDNTGVFHFGFDEKILCAIVKSTGFKNVVYENINTINKPQRDYGVFLLSAKR
ncbi:MAG: class I SAM-dependent methyltransferase [Sulfurimonas sp.]|nr:class I SAM-dependent methyltransferase [Sulfurimonas sp.]MDQ7061653.1 class I SAM-dependent methyltransferase [Sulfurimonas sp.]